ncbi:MAG: NHL repeat-containing protein [Phycisphaerales bacterium]|nr:NHL repeat-containing protein [Phycisphaerales bacterium]
MPRPHLLPMLLTMSMLATIAAAQAPALLDRYEWDYGNLHAPVAVQWLSDDRFVIVESAPVGIRIFDWPSCSTPIKIDCLEPAGLDAGPDETCYLVDSGRHQVMHIASDGSTLSTIGSHGDGLDQFRAPADVAVHEDRLYVADTGNDRIVVLDTDGSPVRTIGTRGTGPGQFRRPLAIDIDASNRIVVADADNHRIQVLSLEGEPITAWGSWGSFPGLLQEPSDVLCLEDRILVTDRLNHRVQEFAMDGTLLHAWGMHAVKPREGQGRVHYPDALAISPDGRTLAVVESFEDRVQLFGPHDPDYVDERPTQPARSGIQSHFGPTVVLDDRIMMVWEPEARAALVFDHQRSTPIRLTSIFSRGDGPGGFGHLADLHWDHEANQLHLFDRGTAQVHAYELDLPDPDQPRFDPSMAKLQTSRTLDASIPMHRIVDAERSVSGNWFLLDGTDGVIHVLNANMEPVDRWGTDLLGHPTAITIDPTTGHLLVLDRDPSTLHQLDTNGSSVATIRLEGIPGGLVQPTGLAVAGSGDILLTDAGTHAVHRLGSDGTHLASWGTKGILHEQFWKPAGIVVDDQDRVIVLDHGNHRCQMFDLDGTWLMTFGAGRAYTPSNRPPLDSDDP